MELWDNSWNCQSKIVKFYCFQFLFGLCFLFFFPTYHSPVLPVSMCSSDKRKAGCALCTLKANLIKRSHSFLSFKFLGWEIPPGSLNSYIYQIQIKGWHFWDPISASLSSLQSLRCCVKVENQKWFCWSGNAGSMLLWSTKQNVPKTAIKSSQLSGSTKNWLWHF